ncbi:MAG: hypothetical protein AAF264_02960 [Pseudomonadota bacterium]
MTPLTKPFLRNPASAVAIVLLAVAILSPKAALAYVGPGAGLTAIGTMIALVAAILLAVVGFVWYPIKRMLRARKTDDAPTEARSAEDS